LNNGSLIFYKGKLILIIARSVLFLQIGDVKFEISFKKIKVVSTGILTDFCCVFLPRKKPLLFRKRL
jgi:hypothetical protein